MITDKEKIKLVMDCIIESGIQDENILGDGFSKVYDMAGTPSFELIYELAKKWKETNERGKTNNP